MVSDWSIRLWERDFVSCQKESRCSDSVVVKTVVMDFPILGLKAVRRFFDGLDAPEAFWFVGEPCS